MSATKRRETEELIKSGEVKQERSSYIDGAEPYLIIRDEANL